MLLKKKAQPTKEEMCMNQRPSIDLASLVLFFSCGGEMPCFIYLLFPTTLLSFFLYLFQLGFCCCLLVIIITVAVALGRLFSLVLLVIFLYGACEGMQK